MPVDSTQADLGTQAAPEERSQAMLVVVLHAEARLLGARVRLGGTLVMGRSDGTFGEGAMDDALLSGRHVQIRWAGGTGQLKDLGSLNGTTVNGTQVHESALSIGDVVGLGSLLLMVVKRPACTDPRPSQLLGRSACIANVLRQVDLVASRETAVLLLGETGTGKELVARELHDRSGRAGRLVAVNCGAIRDEMVHSELFGHARGAFTGAGRTREGLVKAAAGGTLFLDEIGEASASFQIALLRLLQEREYRPVGSDRVLRADVRIVAATHQDLHVDDFRPDLAARLGRWPIHLPPLRDRAEDIGLLARHFAEEHAQHPVTLGRSLVLALIRHDWPGNVRELDAAMERIVVEAQGAERLGRPSWLPQGARKPARGRPGPIELRRAMADAGGNMKALAETYAVSRNTLYRWFRDHDLDPALLRAEQKP
jgi:transcriptional regulator with GAF, ATPase, and Fis domain